MSRVRDLKRTMPVAHRVDRALAEVGETFHFLPAITPINGDEAWQAFRAGGFGDDPPLAYRPLGFDPDRVKRELYRLPIEKVEEPVLAQLLRGKQEELALEISMLQHRGTQRFFYGSLQLYGEPDDELKRIARLLLDELPPPSDADGDLVDSDAMADAARREIARYRERYDGFAAQVEVREDAASLLVRGGDLVVPADKRFARRRVEPLLHHEVGTHLVTYYNGDVQPLRLLCSGLAGYDPIQEGLAVLAEHLCGGLTRGRLRLLAARVLAAAGLVERWNFATAYAFLVDELGFRPRPAFDVTVRIYRGGGLTKDMIYLRGLRRVIAYLRNGGDLTLLLVGKVALEHVAALEDLAALRLLAEPRVKPRYLELDGAAEKLDKLCAGATVLDLAKGATT